MLWFFRFITSLQYCIASYEAFQTLPNFTPTANRRNQICTIHLTSFTAPSCSLGNTTRTVPFPLSPAKQHRDSLLRPGLQGLPSARLSTATPTAPNRPTRGCSALPRPGAALRGCSLSAALPCGAAPRRSPTSPRSLRLRLSQYCVGTRDARSAAPCRATKAARASSPSPAMAGPERAGRGRGRAGRRERRSGRSRSRRGFGSGARWELWAPGAPGWFQTPWRRRARRRLQSAEQRVLLLFCSSSALER